MRKTLPANYLPDVRLVLTAEEALSLLNDLFVAENEGCRGTPDRTVLEIVNGLRLKKDSLTRWVEAACRRAEAEDRDVQAVAEANTTSQAPVQQEVTCLPGRESLEKALVKAHPALFRDYHGDWQETCMAWGCECGPGWYPILEALSSLIDGYNRHKEESARVISWESFLKHWCGGHEGETLRERRKRYVTANYNKGRNATPWGPVYYTQIKEKFGELTVYLSWSDEFLQGALVLAACLSNNTCESCGSHVELQVSQGWISVRCKSCAEAEADEGVTREWRPL